VLSKKVHVLVFYPLLNRFLFWKQERIKKLVLRNGEQTSCDQQSYLYVRVKYDIVTTRTYRVTQGHD